MASHSAEVVDLVGICKTFPQLPREVVPREAALTTVETIFEDGATFVLIDGPPNTGKTTFMAQFALKHAANTISLFVSSISRFNSEPWLLKWDLCNQISWALDGKEMEDPSAVDDQLLLMKLHKLKRRAQIESSQYYIVIDGLDEVSEEDLDIYRSILDLMPFSSGNFRFLVSAPRNMIPQKMRLSNAYRSHALSVFTLEETRSYLGDLLHDEQVLYEVHASSKGRPGHLASVRRLLQQGVPPHELVVAMPEKLPELFELEWSVVNANDHSQIRLLSVLAVDRRLLTTKSLGQIASVKADKVKALLEPLGFIVFKDQDEKVTYVSESFRSFARSKLAESVVECTDLVIDDMMEDPLSETSITHLPSLLEQAGKYDDLLSFLSQETFSRILEVRKSLSAVQVPASRGLKVARHMKRDADMFKFVLTGSILTKLANTSTSLDELHAFIALKDFDASLALANSAPLLEDRLEMLAAVAKSLVKLKMPLDPGLVSQIRDLYEHADYLTLGERAFDIASDLLYSAPDLANHLVDKASQKSTDDNARDWAYAGLSLRALQVEQEGHCPPSASQELLERISNPIARRFAAESAIMLKDVDAAAVINQVKEIGDTSDQLYMLRQWCKRNRQRNDAIEVVDFAIKTILSTTSYSPNARVFRELSEPLPYATDAVKLETIIRKLTSQLDALQRVGPTEECIRLRLILARVEISNCKESARDRLIDTWAEIHGIEEFPLRAASLAWMVSTLQTIDPEKELERHEGLHSLLKAELAEVIDALLEATADHYHAIRRVIRAMSRIDTAEVLELIMKLNTRSRRDSALGELVQALCNVPDRSIQPKSMVEAIDMIHDEDVRDEAIEAAIRRLAGASEDADRVADESLQLLAFVHKVQDASLRCTLYARFFSLTSKHTSRKYDSLGEQLLSRLDASWQAINSQWVRSRVGFRTVGLLAESSVQAASERSVRYAKKVPLEMAPCAFTYLFCLRLTIRAYAGLLPRRLDSQIELQQIRERIDQLPSAGDQAKLWAELALHLHQCGRTDDCRKIVREHVNPLVTSISDVDIGYKRSVIIFCAPAFFCAHRLTALDKVASLPALDRDKSYALISDYLLTKTGPSEPFDYFPGQTFKATYEELVDICDLLEQMSEDWLTYMFIRRVCDAASARSQFTQEQRSDIAQKLSKVVSDKLPDADNIQHEGYRIAAQSHILRLKRSSRRDWIQLSEEASKIPNVCDKAYVLGIIAANIPQRDAVLRDQLFEESLAITGEIPSDKDRIERYHSLASLAWGVDTPVARRALRLSMSFAAQRNEPEYFDLQRKVIDLAYKLDPEFAASLASLGDSDPARKAARDNLQAHLKALDTHRTMASPSEGPELGDVDHYPQAAWMLLASLNCGRVTHQPPERLRDYVAVVATLPIEKAYPVLALSLQNSVARFSNTDEANTRLRSTFAACLQATDLALHIASISSYGLQHAQNQAIEFSANTGVVIPAGERDAALEFLRDWLMQFASDNLKIQDPYLGPEELSILKFVLSASPHCHVHLLTSRKHQVQEGVEEPWARSYREYWRAISAQPPPDTDITIVGLANGSSPIHERWWVANGSGIKIGKSFNGLGIGSESDILQLSPEQALARESLIDDYLFKRKREQDGQRIIYEGFNLQ